MCVFGYDFMMRYLCLILCGCVFRRCTSGFRGILLFMFLLIHCNKDTSVVGTSSNTVGDGSCLILVCHQSYYTAGNVPSLEFIFTETNNINSTKDCLFRAQFSTVCTVTFFAYMPREQTTLLAPGCSKHNQKSLFVFII